VAHIGITGSAHRPPPPLRRSKFRMAGVARPRQRNVSSPSIMAWMNSRTRSRRTPSIGSNQLSNRTRSRSANEVCAHEQPWGHGLPMRGNNHLIICRYGSPLDGIRSTAFLAKGLACSSVCRLSFGSDIHSRMIFRRASCSGFMSKFLWSQPSSTAEMFEIDCTRSIRENEIPKTALGVRWGERRFRCPIRDAETDHFPRMARNRGDFKSPHENNGEYRTVWLGRQDSNLCIPDRSSPRLSARGGRTRTCASRLKVVVPHLKQSLRG
jgi:hypothetical protein